ncbi:DNA-binding transcriptional regulator, LysR family [Aquisalimonas asiatica]|uniref:DNA-binding transcriptional regulator, LysR family n=1 Tax=Aquisalimonas asiatica TaxID=406100 RepID=A0A1H8PWE2_9GAMM|nr:DNA-binding transcriptional regulator, LysR family [Aquisalimonas asiatica]
MQRGVPFGQCMSDIVVMHEVELRRVDLNLLVVLEALLEERSVTRASARLGMSQPAVSRALGRLRRLFGDRLLVETQQGYVLTARAEALQPTLRGALIQVGTLLEATPFDPAAATGKVRLLMLDLETAVLAPPLLARLAAEAPNLDLDVAPVGPAPLDALERDAVDAVVGVIEEAPAGIHRRGLYDDRLVTLMRTGHPSANRALTLDHYLQLGHIVVSVTGEGTAPVDAALARMGRRRRVHVRVPSFLAAVEIAAHSDLVMTLPASLARTAAGMGRFVEVPPPLHLPEFTMSLLWHARHQTDPRHVWLREAIVAATRP